MATTRVPDDHVPPDAKAKRLDWNKHREQVRRANRARYRAIQRLIELHRWEFEDFYAEEAAKEGVEAKTTAPPRS